MTNRLLALTPVYLGFRLSLVTAECGSSYYVCPSGECIKWRFYCNGQCECLPDCSDEDPRRCQVPGGQNADSLNDSSSSSTMSSGAMAGIVIACLAMLFLLVAALIVFLVCRRRLLAAKPTQSRRPVADVRALQESGCGLPVDIPVEALAREPPPRYTSVDRLSTSSTSHQHDLSVGSLPPPPPYSVQTSAMANRTLADETLTMPPFNLDASRRSVSGIIVHTSSPRVAPRAGSASAGRLRSVDSFTEYPSMSDILLTSSRSSLPTSSDSAAAAAMEEMVASPVTRRSDSARGDSIDSWPSSEHGDCGFRGSNSDPPQRSCSLTDVAVAHGSSSSRRQTVPDSELQRQARRCTAGAPPPRTASLDHCISMDPSASRRDEVGQRKRRGTDAGSAAVQQRHRRRQNGDQKQGQGRRSKSRSLSQMTTVDEEHATTTTSRLETPAFTGSPV